MRYVLGVDGGTSKTDALVADAGGAIAGIGRGGGSNIYEGDPETLLGNAAAAAMDALDGAGVTAADLDVAVFSMSGADWPEDFACIEASMAKQGLGRRIIVVNDAIGGLRAGSPDGTGVAVICGTAVATAARDANGAMWHSSFWQGANGALDLGRKALRAVYRAELGIDPPTALTPAVLDACGMEGVEEILHHATAREGAERLVASSVARVLLTVAEDGDPEARRIVAAHGDELGEYALAAARKVVLPERGFPLVLAGGVFRHPGSLLVDALVARMRTASPDVTVLRSPFEPVVGALLLAFEAAGVMIDEGLLARMNASLAQAR